MYLWYRFCILDWLQHNIQLNCVEDLMEMLQNSLPKNFGYHLLVRWFNNTSRSNSLQLLHEPTNYLSKRKQYRIINCMLKTLCRYLFYKNLSPGGLFIRSNLILIRFLIKNIIPQWIRARDSKTIFYRFCIIVSNVCQYFYMCFN